MRAPVGVSLPSKTGRVGRQRPQKRRLCAADQWSVNNTLVLRFSMMDSGGFCNCKINSVSYCSSSSADRRRHVDGDDDDGKNTVTIQLVIGKHIGGGGHLYTHRSIPPCNVFTVGVNGVEIFTIENSNHRRPIVFFV